MLRDVPVQIHLLWLNTNELLFDWFFKLSFEIESDFVHLFFMLFGEWFFSGSLGVFLIEHQLNFLDFLQNFQVFIAMLL
jgi:hypothetical protein